MGRVSFPPVAEVTYPPSQPSANQASFGPQVMPTRWLRMPALTDLWSWDLKPSVCVLPTLFVHVPPTRDAKSTSFVAAGSEPRMKRPRRSMGFVPPPTAGSFVPSAKSQPAGQASPLNAMMAPGGTVYWSISFHFAFVSVSFVAAVSVEYAAYQAEAPASVAKNAKAESTGFR